MHAFGFLEGGVPLVKANGGEKSLAWAKGDWVILVQAKGGQAPLVQAKEWYAMGWGV